jgi:phage shock protein PspC (stress-responsive transcriptional regulator)
MNKILTINLGGFPYTIDEDAFEILNNYLESLRRHFRNNASYQEIIGDIEGRLAEIFGEKLGTRSIINKADVESAISIMGTPEDFAAESTDNTTSANTSNAGTTQDTYTTGKRLMRDVDDKVLGGVCAGLAAYFGVKDPLWIRLGFALAFFSFGVGFMLYFILWVILPKANSSADRLAMRGRPINVENIAKTVEEEFNHISNRFGNTATNTTGAYQSSSNSGFSGFLNNIFSIFGQIFYGILNFVKTISKPFIFLFGVLAVVILACLWIAFVIGFKEGYPFVNYIFGQNSFMSNLAFFNGFFCIGLALLGVALVIARVFFKIKIGKAWSAGIGAFWLINGISLGLIGANLGSDFSRDSEISETVFTTTLSSDTLDIRVVEDYRFSDIRTQFGPFKFDHDTLLNGDVELTIKQSENNEFRLVKELSSNGGSREEATDLARNINYPIVLTGNVLQMPEFFRMSNTKYRGQDVNLTLYVPEGKYVKIPEGTKNWFHFDMSCRNCSYNDKDGKTWKMVNGKMENEEMSKRENFQKNIELKDFSKITAEGNFSLIIKKGEKFSVSTKGDQESIEYYDFEKTGSTLRIAPKDDDHKHEEMTVTVTMPSLDNLDLEDLKEVRIAGFSQSKMRIDSKGDFKIEADIDVENTIVNAERTQIVLKGKGKSIEIILDESAELNGKQFEVATATVSMDGNCETEIYATEKVEKRRKEGSLRVDGGAKIEGEKSENE